MVFGAAVASLAPLRPGTLLAERYRLSETLGRPGGFGVTYQAHDTSLFQRAVAVKEYFPRAVARRRPDGVGVTVEAGAENWAFFQDGLERFRREARILSELGRTKHPGIVQVLDVFEANGVAYLVMELVVGETLADILRRRRLTQQEIAGLTGDLCAALEAVHAAGLVHCDIKPANIMRDEAGRWVLIDFGSAKRALGPDRRGDPSTLPLAATLEYAAPELLRTDPQVTPAADVFALCATLYEVVVGKPHGRGDAAPPLSALSLPGVAPGLARMIDAGLALTLRDRPNGVAALRAVGQEKGGLRPPPGSAWGPSPRPPSGGASPKPAGRAWITALALAGLGAVPFAPWLLAAPMGAAALLAGGGLALWGARGRLGLADCALAVGAAVVWTHIAVRLFGGPEAAAWTSGPLAPFFPADATVDQAAAALAGLSLLRLWIAGALGIGPTIGLVCVAPGFALLGVFAMGAANIAAGAGFSVDRLWTAQAGFAALAALAGRGEK